MKSRSIIVIRPSLIVTLFCFPVPTLQDRSYKCGKMKILKDLPAREDLDKYLTGLENILRFITKYRHHTDPNVSSGLFLININLRAITKIKEPKMVPSIRTRCRHLLGDNNSTLQYFSFLIQNNTKDIKYMPKRSIYDLLTNEEAWASHLKMYRCSLLNKTQLHSKRELDSIYGNKTIYMNKVKDYNNCIPGPRQSNECITALAQNPINKKMHCAKCNYSKDCADYVRNGTDYGYAITHRLLYLLMARFAIGCTIFSSKEDKKNIDQLCAKIYNEAEFIANHNYIMLDLFLEQIFECALAGHAQFIRRTWLNNVLEFQADNGCFRTNPDIQPLVDTERENWAIAQKNKTKMGELCNSHTTGLAAAVLSAAMRFILERYY